MVDVNKSNFIELLPQIEKSLRTCTFIAIDAEFSGLISHYKLKNSLFDNCSERYLKLKANIEQFTVFQFGLSIFHYHRDANMYSADVYSFSLFPCSFGPLDSRFLSQASSWEFLRAHNFDFNKVAYEGIPFLNYDQEEEVLKVLRAGTMFSNVERSLSYHNEDLLQSHCSSVAQWLSSAAAGSHLDIHLQPTDHCLCYFLHRELRLRFKDVWTFQQPDMIRVQKLSQEAIEGARQKEGSSLDSWLMDRLLGFAKLFRLLTQLKKPLVGHNLLLDLMILYNQMFRSLPSTYSKFSKQIHLLFPIIFDTKFISYRVANILKKDKKEAWASNRLDLLYIFLKTKMLTFCCPKVGPREGSGDSGAVEFTEAERHVHEAAWDAFMSGACLARLAHLLALRRLGEGALPRPLSRVEHFAALAEYTNAVNVIRASVNHVNIGGPDPPSVRPRQLYVRRLDGKDISIDEVTALMATHGSVDVKGHTACSALVAVSTDHSARDIVRAFVGNKTYKVVHYSPLKHSPLCISLLWGGLLSSAAVLAGASVLLLRHPPAVQN